jgi:hypothetical protein
MQRDEITSKLERLRSLDSACQYFGADLHRYRLNRVLPEPEVAALERTHAIALPEPYRGFVLDVGNGGAGPHCGMYPLGFEYRLRRLEAWDSASIGHLARPFPHSVAWNLPPEFWASKPDPGPETSEEDEDRMNDEWDAKLERRYWRSELVDGAIPIADMGSGLRVLLVVSGPEAGTIWEDRRADYDGIVPAIDCHGIHVSFDSWYMAWLDTGIEKYSSHAAPDAPGDHGSVPWREAARRLWRRLWTRPMGRNP